MRRLLERIGAHSIARQTGNTPEWYGAGGDRQLRDIRLGRDRRPPGACG
jgi:hypothetical protein